MSYEPAKENKQVISNDEIDLLVLFGKVINIVKRRFLIILLSLIIGAFLGLSSYIAQKPVYKSTMIGNSDILRNEYVTLLFKNLNDLVKEGNHEKLASYLRISKEYTKNIIKIEASPVVLKESRDALIGSSSTFQIDVTTLDPMQLDTIQKGIIFYIQNNDFVKSRVLLQKKLLQNMIATIGTEINKMDTIRNGMVKMKLNTIGFTLMDPASINNSIVILNEKKINFENSLETLNQVFIIQNFIKYEKPISPQINVHLLTGISTGLICGFILILILEARRKIKQQKLW